jgi:electron transfer flavoprotein alpha subunit
MRILVIAEHDQTGLKTATRHTLTAALQLKALTGGYVDMLVAGMDCGAVAAAAAGLAGVQTVKLAQDPALRHQLAEPLAHLVVGLASDYDTIIGPATAFGKNLLPRVAALLDTQMVGDVIQIKAADTFVRPMYAGNVLATVQSLDTRRVITVRPTSFEDAASDGQAAVVDVPVPSAGMVSRFVGAEHQVSSRPELGSARVVVSGGRALASAEQFQAVLTPLADRLNAALGASRAAVDAGYAPNDWQVGQTGKVVAPDLYIAAGVSGAIQHLAGMKDSKVIVAINKDPDAPMMQVADYALEADLFLAVPELVNALAS